MTNNLPERLKAATCGSRELDARIYCWRKSLEFLSWTEERHSGREIVNIMQIGVATRIKLAEIEISPYTTSLDAALALTAEQSSHSAFVILRIAMQEIDNDLPMLAPAKEKHAALPRYVCAALLTALEAEGGGS